jgi:hypothetical protein
MIDSGDGYATVLDERHLVARKPHKCGECYRVIEKGETYLREVTAFEREMSTHKTCSHCQVVRDWLFDECGGWVWTAIREDIREHAYDGYPMDVIRLAVGMGWKWRTPSGKLMPVPKRALTTDERNSLRRSA